MPGEHDIPTIKFQIFNKSYHISVDKLGHKLGFYTTRGQMTQAYNELLTDFLSEDVKRAFWAHIARLGGRPGESTLMR